LSLSAVITRLSELHYPPETQRKGLFFWAGYLCVWCITSVYKPSINIFMNCHIFSQNTVDKWVSRG